MLVVCNGMIRAGSTLQYNLTSKLVESVGKGSREGGFASKEDFYRTKAQLAVWASDNKIHVIKSHFFLPNSQELMDAGSMRIWKWGEKRLMGNLDEAIQTYYLVNSMPHVFSQKYEDAVGDLMATTKAISVYLGLEATDGILASIAQEYSLERVKQVIKESRADLSLLGKVSYYVRKKMPLGAMSLLRKARIGMLLKRMGISTLPYDHKRGYFPGHISSQEGAAGAWQKELTTREIQTITDRYSAWLRETGYLK